jgi:hypothetical protein
MFLSLAAFSSQPSLSQAPPAINKIYKHYAIENQKDLLPAPFFSAPQPSQAWIHASPRPWPGPGAYAGARKQWG